MKESIGHGTTSNKLLHSLKRASLPKPLEFSLRAQVQTHHRPSHPASCSLDAHLWMLCGSHGQWWFLAHASGRCHACQGLLALLPNFCGEDLRQPVTRLGPRRRESLEPLTWVVGFMKCGLVTRFVWLLCGFGVRACVGGVSGTKGQSHPSY